MIFTFTMNHLFISTVRDYAFPPVVTAFWRVLIVWECALRGREKLTDEALTERLEEWICGEGASAQIDTQGIHLLA